MWRDEVGILSEYNLRWSWGFGCIHIWHNDGMRSWDVDLLFCRSDERLRDGDLSLSYRAKLTFAVLS
jgi:hypothetical protein